MLVHAAIDREVGTTKKYIRRVHETAESDVCFLTDANEMGKKYFQGFFTEGLLIGTVNNIITTIIGDSNIKDIPMDTLDRVLLYELETFLKYKSAEYFVDPNNIADNERKRRARKTDDHKRRSKE